MMAGRPARVSGPDRRSLLIATAASLLAALTPGRGQRGLGDRLVVDGPLADPEVTRASVPERVALAALGLAAGSLGADSAAEAHDGLEFLWLVVGTAGVAFVLASVRGRCRPFTRLARALKLPPMA
jgi:hypothetical protein